jgi:uncharacterized protein YacL
MGQPVSAIGWMDTLILMFPKWKRKTVAFVASLVGAFCTGYVIGLVLNSLIVGAYMLTGSMFLVWTIYILGLCCAMYLGSKVGKKINDLVMDDMIGKKMEALATDTKNKISSWFSKSKVTS